MRDYSRSVKLYEESREHLAGGVSSNFRYGGKPVPLFFARGEGCRLFDVDGNVYIDYALGNGPVILGHTPPSVLDSVAQALQDGQLYAAQHERELSLAKALTRIIPCADLVRFSSSGSEAIHAALRLARAFTDRPKIVKFEGHYHGWFDNIFISVHPSLNAAGPAQEPYAVAETPGQLGNALADVIVLPWNDPDVLADTIRQRGDEIAGIIMEPILCNTGVILPKSGYLEGARELCSERGIVLIFDEVITGFRVGLGGAQAFLGVTPDLAVFAKALAAGFTLSCLAGRRDIMELVETRGVMHGGTYNGNVLSISACLAAVAELERDDGQAYRTMEAEGRRLMDGLRSLAGRYGHPLLVQGLGTVFHPDFTEQESITDYRSFCGVDRDMQRSFLERLQHGGVRPTARGTWFLSTAHAPQDIDETLEVAESALRDLKNQ